MKRAAAAVAAAVAIILTGCAADVDELRGPTTSAYAALDARDQELEGDDE